MVIPALNSCMIHVYAQCVVGTSQNVVGGADELNVAVTDWFCVIETVHVVLLPVQAPLHPENVDPALGEAVRMTEVPLVKEALQVLPQFIPVGELVTVPLPVPALLTDNW